jgi:hypothetical protein
LKISAVNKRESQKGKRTLRKLRLDRKICAVASEYIYSESYEERGKKEGGGVT